MLDLDELKEMQDRAYNQNQTTRENAADDMLFAFVTQWDDSLLDTSQLQYRGEFNILRKAQRQIIADLRSNPVQINFEPKAESRDDGADLLDGLYLSDDRINTSIEAKDNAKGEAVVCGVGAWELYTEYESNRMGNENQVIRRQPIYEANNNLFWDPNAKRLDKSDANFASILTSYTHEGYLELVEELTGEKPDDIDVSSFSNPEQSYVFPWASGGNDNLYVSTFYHREKIEDKILTMVDPMGQPLVLRESDLSEIMDELLDAGYDIQEERVIERWQVTKYIASGAEIIDSYPIAGENIPVVPTYGERAFIEGEEHYEGITRLAKDPQRLRNFQLSYLADIVSRSPRPKPIFNPEQLQGFEFMYDETGPDNNFPYMLQNRLAVDGTPLQVGPVAMMPETPVPSSLMMAIQESKSAVEDVANPALPNDIADPDLSGKAMQLITARLDQQSMVYQQNFKHADRRDAEIYASMAVEVYDAPRKMTVTLPDGTRKTESLMDMIQDKETGEMVVLNDLTNMEFDVYAEVGPSYNSKKEQTLEQLGTMAAGVVQSDPAMHKMLMLKQLTLVDGVAFDDIRDYARKELILLGVNEPETPEEEQMVAQAQQNQQPDAMVIAANAEQGKADAANAEVMRKAQADQFTAQTNQAKNQVEVFNAQTKRAEVQVKAQEVGANIRFTQVKTQGQQIDNILKPTQSFRARVNG